VAEIRRILDRAVENGVEIVSFTGGEPLLRIRELPSLINYASSAGIPYIRTGTNGFVFANPNGPQFEKRVNRLAEVLSKTRLRNLWISIDSAVPSVHERMRGFPGLIDGIRAAIPIFHKHGIYPSANLGINRNMAGAPLGVYRDNPPGDSAAYLRSLHADFKRAFERFYEFIIELGFTIVNTCYPMSVEPKTNNGGLSAVYAATSPEDLVRFTPAEKAVIYKALMETIPKYRSRIRIFSPRSSLYALVRQHGGDSRAAYPCRGGIDYFFVLAKGGYAFPCGYRGDENLGRYQDMKPQPASGFEACRRCDWECFRDPSELFGPILAARSGPLSLLRDIRGDGRFFPLWVEDLKYYRACGLFDGRKPPHYHRLEKFRLTLN
jgi:hypothetical protein